jgi:hypothetical protein
LGMRCTAAPIGSAQAQPDASPLLPPIVRLFWGIPVVVVAGLARSPDHHSTRNSPALASSRNISDLEVSITWSLARRAPQDRRRDPPSDRRHGSREFSLGCTAHSRRAVEAWHHRLAGYSVALYAGGAWRPSITEMADIRTEPCRRDCPQPEFRRAQLG